MFGEKLAAARTAKNLTQEQLAEKLYVTRQAVSRWENDKTQPDLQTLGRICTALEVAPDYFIEVSGDEVAYKTLPKEQKLQFYYGYRKENKPWVIGFYLLTVLLTVCCLGLIATDTLIIVDCPCQVFGISPLIWVIVSAIILVFSLIILILQVTVNILRGNHYNAWLAHRGVVRTKITFSVS